MVAEIEARKSRLTCRLTLTYRAVFVLSECSHSPSGTRRAGQNSGSQTERRAASSLRERVKSPCASSSTTVSIRTDEKDARSSRAGREKNSDSSGGCGRTETTLPFSLSGFRLSCSTGLVADTHVVTRNIRYRGENRAEKM